MAEKHGFQPPAAVPANCKSRGGLLAAKATALLLALAWMSLNSGLKSDSEPGRRQLLSPAPAAMLALPANLPPPAWADGSWQHPLPTRLLNRGIVNEGDPEAAQRLAQKLLSGNNISVVTLGGSLTFGRGASAIGRTDWAALLGTWLRQSFPGSHHTLLNSAVAASPSEYISFCLQEHLPPHPDLVIVEYNINDGVRPWHHPHPRSYERLLRRLLALPSRPLVLGLMLHSFHRHQTGGTFYQSGEAQQATLMQYYGLPWLSMRSVVYRPMQQGTDGFKPQQWLQVDRIHPNDRGHEYIAQLVARFLKRIVTQQQLVEQEAQQERQQQQRRRQRAERLRPGRQLDARALQLHNGGNAAADDVPAAAAAAEPLPPPMLEGALPLAAETCLHSQRLQAAVPAGGLSGFYWEEQGESGRPEIRATTWSPGSQLTVKLDTDVRPADPQTPFNETHTAVLLWYAHSHHWVGNGKATCGGGCTCEPQPLRPAIRQLFGTQDHLLPMVVSRAANCLLKIRTLNSTDTGGHYFRVKGVLVSSEAAVAFPHEFLWGEDLQDMPPQLPPAFDDGLGP